MDNRFFEQPILNSPYEYPSQHWELDEEGQPTDRVLEHRRRAEFITPIPKAKKRQKKPATQEELGFGDRTGISTGKQKYDPTPIINELRGHVDTWRTLPNANQWQLIVLRPGLGLPGRDGRHLCARMPGSSPCQPPTSRTS